MAFSFSDEFFGTRDFSQARRCVCKVHSDAQGSDVAVSTNWERLNENTPGEVYRVTATATHPLCQQSHGGATDQRIIAKAAWDSAAPGVAWEFFPTI